MLDAAFPEVLMPHRYIKIAVTSAVLVLAFAGLLWSTLREGTEYYKDIKEVLPQRQAWEGKPLRLHGYVVPNSILRKPNSLEYRFKVQNDPPRLSQPPASEILEASYEGIVPDTFKDEAEVTLQGRLTPSGFAVDRNGVVAKCPSKYEAASQSPGS
jgi:cytochrome c-type biogenesis protein CcmE